MHRHTWLSEALGGNGNPRGLGGAQGVCVRAWERKACSAPMLCSHKEQVHSVLWVASSQLLRGQTARDVPWSTFLSRMSQCTVSTLRPSSSIRRRQRRGRGHSSVRCLLLDPTPVSCISGAVCCLQRSAPNYSQTHRSGTTQPCRRMYVVPTE